MLFETDLLVFRKFFGKFETLLALEDFDGKSANTFFLPGMKFASMEQYPLNIFARIFIVFF